MRILLDECVDTRLASHLTAFAIGSVWGRAWAGVRNGRLLTLAQREFDVFVTVDKNLSSQRALPRCSIAVVRDRAVGARREVWNARGTRCGGHLHRSARRLRRARWLCGENSSDPDNLQAWCEACEQVFLDEGALTVAFRDFNRVQVVCDFCHATIKSRQTSVD